MHIFLQNCECCANTYKIKCIFVPVDVFDFSDVFGVVDPLFLDLVGVGFVIGFVVSFVVGTLVLTGCVVGQVT